VTETTKELTAAVCKVMAAMELIVKTGTNTFHKYRFLSVDAIKDYLRPLLAQNGLSIRMDEEHFETHEMIEGNSKKGVHAHFRFALSLAHISGECEPPERYSIMLPYDGPTASGKARSYACKEWLKAKFLASTGDKADIEEEHEKEADADKQKAYTKTLPKAKGRAVYERLSGELKMLATKKAFDNWFASNKSDIDTLPDDWQAILRQEAHETLHDIKTRNGNGAPKLAALPPEMEPNQALREASRKAEREVAPNQRLRRQLADSAFGANYSNQLEEWRARLTLADRSSQEEIFETEIEPKHEAGAMLPADYNALVAMIKDQ